MYFYSFNALEAVIRSIYRFLNFFFETVMGYVIIPSFEILADTLFGVLPRLWYLVLMAVMGLLDLAQLATGAISGGRNVTYNGREDYFINVFLFNSGLSRVVWGIVVIAVILVTLFSIIRLVGAMASDKKGQVGTVMFRTAKVAMTVLLIPLLSIAAINMGMLVLDKTGETIAVANNMPEQTKISSMVFAVATAGAQRNWAINPTGSHDYRNEPRYHYISGNQNGRYYWNLFQITVDFDFTRMNFWPALIAGLFFIFVYCNLTLIFVFFMFQIILLFIVAPFFASAMVADDGRMFKKWRDLFLTKIIAGLGLIASIRIYETIMLPLFLSDSFRFFPMVPGVSDILGPEFFPDLIIKTVFLIMFGRAVCKSHSIVTSIINEEAAQDEQAVSEFVKKSAKKTAQAVVDLAILAAAIVAGVFSAGAGSAAVGGAAGALKGAGAAAKVGAKGAAVAGKTVVKQGAKQLAKKTAEKVAKEAVNKVKDTAVDKVVSKVSEATDKITEGEDKKD